MEEELKAQIRKLAEEAALKNRPLTGGATDVPAFESAILAGIALALEREPSEAMYVAGDNTLGRYQHLAAGVYVGNVYRAMTSELLRELREGR